MSDGKGVNRLFLLIVVLFVAVSLLIGFVLPIEMPAYLSVILGQMVILVPGMCYCWKRKIKITELIPFGKIRFSTGVLVVVCTYLMYPLMIVLNAITLLFSRSVVADMQVEMMNYNMVISTALIAMVPACVEEFVFRGLLLQTYRRKRVFFGILMSAFLFGCMHRNLNQFLYTFVMGIFMAFLVEGTGSIFSSMIAHFTLNFTSVLMSYLLKAFYYKQGMDSGEQQMTFFAPSDKMYVLSMLVAIFIWFVIAIGTTIAVVAIFIQICKMNGRWEHMKTIFKKGSQEKMVTPALILGVVLTIAIIILQLIGN